MRNSAAALIALCLACGSGGAVAPARDCDAAPLPASTARVGQSGGGAVLPNGDGLAPLGERLVVHQSPLNLVVAPDGHTVALAEFGLHEWGVEITQAAAGALLSRSAQRLANGAPGGFLRGLAFTADGATLYAANTGRDAIEVLQRGPDGAFVRARAFGVQGQWPADLALSADGSRLYVSLAVTGEVQAYDPGSGALLERTQTGGRFPNAMLLAGGRLYVADEGAEPGRRNRVEAYDPTTLQLAASWSVGKNPSALAISPDGATLFVAASDDDWIDRIDLKSGDVHQPFIVEQPRDPAGGAVLAPAVQPSALALSPDGNTLYVAAANLNAVLVLDAKTGITRGALPAGWRPTALALIDGGATLLIANYRGEGTRPSHQHIDGIDDDVTPGSLQRVAPIPEGDALAAATQTVAQLLSRPLHEYAAPDPACARVGPLPAVRGGNPSLSRIHHVIVVFKENKTFDAVFGDFPGAEAARELLLWGDKYTPNQHELARRYCLLDDFHTESDISLEGHYWMTAQTSTDYFDRIYGAADGDHVQELPLQLIPGGFNPVDTPRNGFIWDRLALANVPYRSFGEFIGLGGDLGAHLDFGYVDDPRHQLSIPDTQKLKTVLALINAGKLPAFSFVEMQWDHTFGVSPGRPAPDYMVADNDAATGQLVEAVSKSAYWSDTLILITEDDPAGGDDHVDRRRSFALVVSPWAQRGRVSHQRAAFPSLAATWERALGVTPASRYDAASEPLWDCLTAVPDYSPYTALPANIAPHNSERGDPGEEETRGIDLSQVDRAPLGAALWKYMRRGEPLPPGLAAESRRHERQRSSPSFRTVLRSAAGARTSTVDDDDD